MQTLKKRIEDGEIGEITKIHVECQAWFSQLGTHYVDYILWANGGHRAKWVCGHVQVRFVWMITIRHQITCLVLWNWKMEYMLM